MSQQLSALEKAAGQRLLRRVGRRVELTDAGAALARYAERMLGVESEAVAALERTTTAITGTVHVGLFATAAAEILPIALTQIQHKHPNLSVRSKDMDVDDVHDAVASRAVDLAVGLDYPDVPIRRDPALRQVVLYRERFSLAFPAGTTSSERISLGETGSYGWILPAVDSHYGRAILTVCRRAGIEPDVRHEVTDTAASLALVEAGVGITTVTDLMLGLRPSRVDVVPLAEPFERHIVTIVRAEAESRPTVGALISVLRELALTKTVARQG